MVFFFSKESEKTLKKARRMSDDPILKVENVIKTYKSGASDLTVLHNVAFEDIRVVKTH